MENELSMTTRVSHNDKEGNQAYDLSMEVVRADFKMERELRREVEELVQSRVEKVLRTNVGNQLSAKTRTLLKQGIRSYQHVLSEVLKLAVTPERASRKELKDFIAWVTSMVICQVEADLNLAQGEFISGPNADVARVGLLHMTTLPQA